MPDRRRLTVAFRRELRHVMRLNLATLFDLLHAVVELAIARLCLSMRKTQDLLSSPMGQHPFGRPGIARNQVGLLIDRVSFAIPRMGARVPWRADCLVQALAAQSWLGRHQIETALVIGVLKRAPSNLEAHAWLKAGHRIVTGGEVEAYQVVLEQPINPKAKVSAPEQQ